MRAVAICLIAITTTSSIGCSHFGPKPELRCHRPNQEQKDSWRAIRWASRSSRPEFAPAVEWISDILEKDCFPEEAEAARDAGS